jgi:hypothetical protein
LSGLFGERSGIKQLAEFNVLTHKVKHCAA